MKHEDNINAQIKRECRGNDNQKSIKKIAAHKISLISSRRLGGVATAREIHELENRSKKIKSVSDRGYLSKSYCYDKRKDYDCTPMTCAVYKQIGSVLYFVGCGPYFTSPWSRWSNFVHDTYRFVDFGKMSETAQRNDHRKTIYGLHKDSKLGTDSFILLNLSDPVSESEFSMMAMDDFTKFRENFEVQTITLDGLRDLCVRNSIVPDRGTDSLDLLDMPNGLLDSSAYTNEKGEVNLDAKLNLWLNRGKKINYDPEGPKIKKIGDWPEMAIRAMGAVMSDDDMWPIGGDIIISDKLRYKFFRNKRSLKKKQITLYQMYRMFFSPISQTPAQRSLSHRTVGSIGHNYIYYSPDLKDYETVFMNSEYEAEHSGMKYIKISITL